MRGAEHRNTKGIKETKTAKKRSLRRFHFAAFVAFRGLGAPKALGSNADALWDPAGMVNREADEQFRSRRRS